MIFLGNSTTLVAGFSFSPHKSTDLTAQTLSKQQVAQLATAAQAGLIHAIDAEALAVLKLAGQSPSALSTPAAPTQPVQRGPLKSIAIIGDSITANASNVLTPEITSSHGYWTWADIFSGHRTTFQPGSNLGIGGNTTADVLARLSSLIKIKPDIAVVAIGTNDITGALTAQQSIANLKNIWDQLYQAGIVVIACTILPRTSSWGLTAAMRNQAVVINNFIRSQQGVRPNFEVVDATSSFLDYTAMDGFARAGLQIDGLHPAQAGAFLYGAAVADVIKRLVPQRDELQTDPTNVWSLTNPSGNLVANGLLAGTTGSKGTGCTGNVATSWALALSATNAGMAVVATKEAHPTLTGLERQTLAISGALTANCQAIFSQTLNYVDANSAYQPGDVVEAMCEIEVVGQSNLAGVQLDIRNQDTSNALKYAIDCNTYGSSYTAAQQLPDGKDWSGIFRTQPFVVPANPANIRPRIVIQGWSGRTVGGTIKIGRVTLRKVIQ